MTITKGLTQSDLEQIERIIFKNGDDTAVSIARSFERLEERLDATESRLYSRFSDVEDKIEEHRQTVADELQEIRSDLHGLAKAEATLDA